MKLLLENGANLNARTEHSSMALALAADGGDLGVIKLFLQGGTADIHASDNEGDTAATLGASIGRKGCVGISSGVA